MGPVCTFAHSYDPEAAQVHFDEKLLVINGEA